MLGEEKKQPLRPLPHLPELSNLPELLRESLFDEAVRESENWPVTKKDIALQFGFAVVILGLAVVLVIVLRPAESTSFLLLPLAIVVVTRIVQKIYDGRRIKRILRQMLLRRGIRPAVCFGCGYNLRASTSGTCPECGMIVEMERGNR